MNFSEEWFKNPDTVMVDLNSYDPNSNFDRRRMGLVIKPTDICNFSCDFCSSPKLVEDKKIKLSLDRIYLFLKRYPLTDALFIVGGDPLMMPPEWFRELLDHIDANGYKCKVAITTNLWAWYKNPEKWNWFLRHPNVEVGTSFQYGGGRKITPTKEFTEEIFRDVHKKFKEEVPGKELCFLAVISEENEHLALKHVYLAKELQMQCRLVWAVKSGRSGTVYPMARLYKIILEIHRLGLTRYEQTAVAISEKIGGIEVACPMSRNCDHSMRSINPDGRYFSCGPMNDDLDVTNEIDFESEVVRGEKFYLPVQADAENNYLKLECFGCKMFQTCNACRKHVKDLKSTNKVEEHCTTMKSIMDDLEKMATSSDIEELKMEPLYVER